ncbi:MAG: TlpA family protein disulfide reductase [Alphaproteobacteria bacterium]|nr:TlpA family protein disulfide reductase [Alphaproteobacteria bacterium]
MTRITQAAALGMAVALSGCSDPMLAKKVEDLEAKVTELEKKIEAGGGGAEKSGKDEEAMAMYREANEAFRGGKNDEAKAKLTELLGKYGDTRLAAPAQRLLDQLTVVGKEISALKVDEWYQGESSLSDGKASLLVFWEVWCPHCKREVPKLQETYDKYKGDGLQVIGLTKLTRDKTPEDVKAFIAENKVGYPIAKEAGDMSDFFGVSGVPAAATVKDGKVVWRGHPAQITDEMIKEWTGT